MLIDWARSPAILTGFQSNHLINTLTEDSITLYANNQLLATYSDGTYHGTGLGMISEFFSGNYNGHFNNLLVYPGCFLSQADSMPFNHTLFFMDLWTKQVTGSPSP